MSSLINKAKDMISKDKNTSSHSATTNEPGYYGMADTNTAGEYDNQNVSGSTNAGPHKSNLMNKLDPRVDSDRDHRNDPSSTYGSSTSGGEYTGQTYSGSTNAGPHSSNLANKADPRVDSDRDHRNDPNSTYGSSTGGGEYTGQTYSGSTNAGPHDSNMANKLDPRVDSDRDNRNDPTSRVGGYGQQENYGVSGSNPAPSGHGNHGNTGYGQQTTGAGFNDNQNTTMGTHPGQGGGYSTGFVDNNNNSSMGTTQGSGAYSTGFSDNQNTTMGSHPGHGAYSTGFNNNQNTTMGTQGGEYSSGYDPKNTGFDNYNSSATPGSGNANQTAGPHNSNMMNKLDPRVDSDMDGSKTYGGNKTNY